MKVHSGILTKARTTCTGRAVEMSEVPSSPRAWADQSKAIVEGLRDSVDEFQRSVPGTTFGRTAFSTYSQRRHSSRGALMNKTVRSLPIGAACTTRSNVPR